MKRLLVHVEGQTEETFVNELLSPHLLGFGYEKVAARLMGNARQRQQRGGISGWATVRRDLTNHLKEDAGSVGAVMVDYYALPSGGGSPWPGRAAASTLAFDQKAPSVNTAIAADVAAVMGNGFNNARFVPYVMMHEFEGLLFSDCTAFANGVGNPSLAPAFQAVRDAFPTPEHINDSPITAPSKRVSAIVSGYDKPLFGTLAALEIGLDKMRSECRHLDEWLTKLEAIP
jgi:hypothetical protein